MTKKTVEIPADALGNTVDGRVIADVVEAALQATPCVVLNHIRGRFNDLVFALDNCMAPEARYRAAVQLAGIAMRFALENR
jgi:HEAT repeat protein